MADTTIIDPSVWASWDGLDASKEPDFSPVLLAALNSMSDLTGMIPIGEDTKSRRIDMLEKDLNPNTVQLNDGTGVSNVDTVFTFDDVSWLIPGAQLFPKTGDPQKDREVIYVSGVDYAAKTATVTRDYGAVCGTGYAHADDTVYDVALAEQEASTARADRTRAKTSLFNHTQIFPTDIKMSRNAMRTAWRNVPDAFAESLEDRAIEVRKMIQRAVIRGVRNANTPHGDEVGTMGGIMWHVMKNGGSNWYDTPSAFDYNFASKMIDERLDAGVNGNFVLAVTPTLYKTAAAWVLPRQRSQYSADGQTIGGYVDEIVSKEGGRAKLVIERMLPAGSALLVDLNRIKMRFFDGSRWITYITPLGTGGNDFKMATLLSELTLDMRNIGDAHAVATQLT